MSVNDYKYILDPAGAMWSGPQGIRVGEQVLIVLAFVFMVLAGVGVIATFIAMVVSGLPGLLVGVGLTAVLFALFLCFALLTEATEAAYRETARASGALITEVELRTCTDDHSDKIVQARKFVHAVMTSRASREGWIGEVDFAPDLYAIASLAIEASATERLVDEMAALPDRGDLDNAALSDGRQLLGRLTTQIDDRLVLLQKAADRAGSIDEEIARQQTRDRQDKRREELRAELTSSAQGRTLTAEATPTSSEQVEAQVLAFHEVQEIIAKARAT